MLQRLYHATKPATNRLKRAYHLIEEERKLRTTFDMPRRTRLRAYRHGFTSRAPMLYDFRKNGTDAYLSDFDRFIKSPEINADWSVFLDNKLAFHHLLNEHEDHRVPIYGVLRDGRVHAIDEPADPSLCPGRWIRRLLDEKGRLVVKPVTGGGGKNVRLCRVTDEGYQVNGAERTGDELVSLMDGLEDYIVCEFIEQASYARELYSATSNTIRVLTMIHPETDEPFIAQAIQRMGAKGTGPVDNFSDGGLSASIDTATGRLGTAAQYPHPDRATGIRIDDLEWHATHPDSGAEIQEVEIPAWNDVRDRLLEIADDVSYVPYVGWDVIVTDDGSFKVIEANSHTGVKALQVHGPLLADERVRDFYERYGVIS